MMVGVAATLWKLYMMKFMVTSVVRWVILPLLVTSLYVCEILGNA
jgi:hypothetical protein